MFCCCWFCLTDRSPASPDRGKSRKPSRSPECHAGVTARGAASQPASPSALRERDGDYRRAGVLRPPPPAPLLPMETLRLFLLLRSPPRATATRERARCPAALAAAALPERRGGGRRRRRRPPAPALPQAPSAPPRANDAPPAPLPTPGKAAPEGGNRRPRERVAEARRGRGQGRRRRSPPPGAMARAPAPWAERPPLPAEGRGAA